MQALLFSSGMTLLIAWLFYGSLYGLFMLPVVCPVWLHQKRKQRIKETKQLLCREFKDAIQAVYVAMQAGYSVENAWREAQKDMEDLHGKTSQMAIELRAMNMRIRLNEPVEKILMEFAVRSQCDDIISFSQVFQFAKRSGGNFAGIMGTTIHQIQSRMEVQQEIETVLAAKKLEQKVMDVVPIGILIYMNLSSPGYLTPLYGNLFGIAVMTVCLGLYGGSVYVAGRISDIQI